MKILVYSDTHWAKPNLEYLISTYDWIAKQIREQNPDLVVFGGDLNHNHQYIDVTVLDYYVVSYLKIQQACADVRAKQFVLSGNHDQPDSSARRTALSIFRLSGIEPFVTKPELVEAGPYRFVFAPYPPYEPDLNKEYFDDLAKILKKKADIVFSHWDILGAPYRPGGIKTKHGVGVQGMNCSAVVNGHYHHPGVNDTVPCVITTGSPAYYGFSDCLTDVPRGVLTLDLDSGEVPEPTWFRNPHTVVYHTVEDMQGADLLVNCGYPSNQIRLKVKPKEPDKLSYILDKISSVYSLDSFLSIHYVGVKMPEENKEELPVPDLHIDYKDILFKYVSDSSLDGVDTKTLIEQGEDIIRSVEK